MEGEVVLIGSVVLGSLWCIRLLLRPLKNPPPVLSPKSAIGFFYAGLFLLALGIANLFFGFRDSEMYWVSRGWGHRDGWIAYQDFKRAYAFLGFMSTSLASADF